MQTVIRGSGNIVSEARKVSDFKRVILAGVGDLTIEQTGTESLIVEAEDNLLPVIVTEVRGNTLYIGVERNAHFHPTRPIRYRLTVRPLDSIELSGSGTIEARALDTDELKATLSGSGRMDLDRCSLNAVTISGSGDITVREVRVPDLRVTISGSGRLSVAGTVESQSVRIPGSGAYNAEKLESREASIDVSGAGHARVNVSETLNATISGSGLITYTGGALVTKRISGSGAIRKG